jgi:hypothetical protein
LAIDLLPRLDFEAISAAEPTGLVGYSDLTTVTVVNGALGTAELTPATATLVHSLKESGEGVYHLRGRRRPSARGSWSYPSGSRHIAHSEGPPTMASSPVTTKP